MDAVSYSHSAKQAKRIKKFINEPDSSSGVVTVPKVIASGETITIPTGRMAVLPNVQVDGTLNVQGDVFIPSGATMSKVVEKVTSTDNAIVRFNGTTGDVQNSGVIIDDNNNTILPTDKFVVFGTSSTASQNYHIGGVASDSSLRFYNGNFGAGTERMRIDSNGNVGIGVTPSANHTGINIQIGVAGAIRSNNGTSYMSVMSNSAGGKYINNDYAALYEQAVGKHFWYTAPSGTAGNAITWINAMTLDASGNLNVGGATDNYVQASSTGGNSFTYIRGRATSGTTEVFYSAVGGVLKAQILSNGSYQSATNSYGSTSDAKLKENVVETSDKLNKLMNVRVVNFNYIGDDQKQIGVIAQEVEKIFPGIVYETKDTEQVEVEKEREKTLEDGTVEIEKYTETETVETGEVTKNVKYSVIYMMMLKGMQEMNAKMEAMQLEIDMLKGAK